ncbi:MAG: c-type cytochrome [Candidatus Binatia bacterium]
MRTLATVVGPISIVLALVLATPHRSLALDGAALYGQHCQRCHGLTGRGDGPDADLFVTRPRDLRSGFLARYSLDDLVRRIRSGAPLELALDPSSLRDRASEVEALAAHLERLPSVSWRRVEEGQALYVDQCELCHGRAGAYELSVPEGGRAPRNLGDPAFQRSVTDDELAAVIRNGRHGMPVPWPISSKETPALIAFVRLLSPGYALYDRYCANCHGDDGRGTGSFGEADARPTVSFDRAYFRRRDPEHVRAAIWHMLDVEKPAMPHLRKTLSEAEARAIVAYLQRGQ